MMTQDRIIMMTGLLQAGENKSSYQGIGLEGVPKVRDIKALENRQPMPKGFIWSSPTFVWATNMHTPLHITFYCLCVFVCLLATLTDR